MGYSIRSCTEAFEAIKTKMDDTVLHLSIHPDQVPLGLRKAKPWTRYMVALVELSDSDEPVAPPSKVEVDTVVAQAAMLAKNPKFQLFMVMRGYADEESEPACAHAIRKCVGVGSRAELRTNEDARSKWREITSSFERHLRGRA